MATKYESLQEEAWAANRALHASGMVSLTFGNVSVADRESGFFSIKPSGVGYQKLNPSDMVVLDFDGAIVAGTLRPSSDTPTHRVLLKKFSDSNSIVHTHSPKAVAFAQAGLPLECFGTTHADYFHGSVPITRALSNQEIETDYELNTGKVILESFENRIPLSTPAVLVNGHGPFTWGESWGKAIENAIALELCASIAIDAILLNPQAFQLCTLLQSKHHSRKHGPTAYYGQV
jgi:L-ribulose-5-phosphate 4-epimerase